MIQQLIEIRNNILSAIEANDNILAKMAINDLDTLLYKVSQEEKKEMYREEEVIVLLQKYRYDLSSGKTANIGDTTNFWFDKNKK